MCLSTLYPVAENPRLVAHKATATNPDILYLHQAMRQSDKIKFIEAMSKEIKDQMDNGNFAIVPKASMPPRTNILPVV